MAIYSSFLQRAYDQIVHDVCIQNLPVVFAVDRAGLVGSDGETHQGVFDLSYLSSIPNMHVMAPKNKWELSDMLKFAVSCGKPIAVRYPRGEAYDNFKENREPIEMGKSEMLIEGNDAKVALFAIGSMVRVSAEAREKLIEKGIDVTVVNARFAKPIDTDMIEKLASEYDAIITMEENVASGGLGEKVVDFVNSSKLDVAVEVVAVPDEYVEHGSVDQLRKEIGIDADAVVERVLKYY